MKTKESPIALGDTMGFTQIQGFFTHNHSKSCYHALVTITSSKEH